MARRSRPLTHSEIALWRDVTKSIKPLSVGGSLNSDQHETAPHNLEASAAEPVGLKTGTVAVDRGTLHAPQQGSKSAPQPAPQPAFRLLPLAPIERPIIRKISRGQNTVDAVLDLHGLRQHEAHERLRRFLHQCQHNSARLVLVVTGKGNSPHKMAEADGWHDEKHSKGVLRRLVPDWLKMPDLRTVVMGFEQAAPHQGGSGALYVRIRKKRAEG